MCLLFLRLEFFVAIFRSVIFKSIILNRPIVDSFIQQIRSGRRLYERAYVPSSSSQLKSLLIPRFPCDKAPLYT